MNQTPTNSDKKGEMLVLSNKTMTLSIDRMTLFLTMGELKKAKKELKGLKGQVAEMERLMSEIEIDD